MTADLFLGDLLNEQVGSSHATERWEAVAEDPQVPWRYLAMTTYNFARVRLDAEGLTKRDVAMVYSELARSQYTLVVMGTIPIPQPWARFRGSPLPVPFGPGPLILATENFASLSPQECYELRCEAMPWEGFRMQMLRALGDWDLAVPPKEGRNHPRGDGQG